MDKPEDNKGALQSSTTLLPEYTLDEWTASGCPALACVVVEGEAEIAQHYVQLVHVQQIIIRFAAFMDGRGFSHARKLRSLGFDGELLAGGELLADQWPFLARCGFSGIGDADIARRALSLPGFSEAYQADALQNDPLFPRRRRA
jgi:uncharacterized protein (DUF934 family)